MKDNKEKLYLLMRTIRDLARYKDGKSRHNLKQKAALVDMLFSHGIDGAIDYYKSRLGVKQNGIHKPGNEKD